MIQTSAQRSMYRFEIGYRFKEMLAHLFVCLQGMVDFGHRRWFKLFNDDHLFALLKLERYYDLQGLKCLNNVLIFKNTGKPP